MLKRFTAILLAIVLCAAALPLSGVDAAGADDGVRNESFMEYGPHAVGVTVEYDRDTFTFTATVTAAAGLRVNAQYVVTLMRLEMDNQSRSARTDANGAFTVSWGAGALIAGDHPWTIVPVGEGSTLSGYLTVEDDAEYWTVTYEPNYGTGTAHSVEVESGGVHTVLSLDDVGFEGPGDSSFDGWARNTGVRGTYQPGTSLTVNSNINLYAIWTHSIEFVANGGTGNMADGIVVRGTNFNVPATGLFTRAGYTLVGFYTAPEAPEGATLVVPGGTLSNVTANQRLYAQWEETEELPPDFGIGISVDPPSGNIFAVLGYSEAPVVTVTVTNEGAQATGTLNIAATGGVEYFNLPSTIASIPVGGYATFTVTPVLELELGAYALAVTISNANIAEEQPINIVFTVTPDHFGYATITYLPNGGTIIQGRPNVFTEAIGAPHTMHHSMFTRDNFVFAGWNTMANGGGESFVPGQVILVQGDIVLHAQWRFVDHPSGVEPQVPTTPVPPTTPTPTPTPPADLVPAHQIFIDVAANAWYHDYVTRVYHAGLFRGTGPNIFEPHINMSRAMFAQVLANLEGVNLAAFAAGAPNFTDTSPAHWGFAAVQWAASEDIIFGMGDGTFAPDAPITREQMAVMLHRYSLVRSITLPTGATPAFADQLEISYWAATAVTGIQAAGIVRGRDDGRFDPRATATRAEVAAIFARFLDILED